MIKVLLKVIYGNCSIGKHQQNFLGELNHVYNVTVQGKFSLNGISIAEDKLLTTLKRF